MQDEQEHMELARRLAAECVVLLENDGTLPLKDVRKIALFGAGARQTVKGGTGSGDVNSRMVINIEQGLKERGFDITTVQMPVFYGHTISVNADLEESVSVDDVTEVFKKSSYVTVKDNDENLTPVEDVINERTVLVSRIRQNIKGSKNVSFVCMMDNTRRGEAISCVEIVKLIAQNI